MKTPRLILVAAGVLWLLATSPLPFANAQSNPSAAVEIENDFEVAQVVVDGRALFPVAGLVDTFPAGVRAERIASRIVALAQAPEFDRSRFTTAPTGTQRAILYGERPIMVVTDGEVRRAAGINIDDLARVYQERIADAITTYREERTPAAVHAAAFRIAAAAVLAGAAVVAVFGAVRFLRRRVEARYVSRVRAVGIQSFQIVRAERIWSVWRALLVSLEVVAIAGLVLGAFQFALAQLPWTRRYSVGLATLVIDPLERIGAGIVQSIPDLVFLAILAIIVRWGLRMLRVFFNEVERGGVSFEEFDRDWALPTYKLLRVVVVVLALVVAYPYIPGSGSEAFKGISIFLGLVVSLGSTTAIANTVAGYALIYRRAFKVGDRVKIGDTVGVVVATRLQDTHLLTPAKEEVAIPNVQLLNNPITNYSRMARDSGVAVTVKAGIGYETPWRQVEAMLLEAARRTLNVVGDPAPFVVYEGLGDFSINYELYAFVRDAHAMLEIHAGLVRNVLDVFNEHGVQIMTPHYMGDTPQPKVVPPKDWYLAPAKGSVQA